MRFAQPHFLWLLLVFPPGLLLFYWWSWRQRQQLMQQFIQARLLPSLTIGLSPTRQKVRMGCLIAGVVFLLVALARPQWGYAWEEVKQRGLDIVVAIDTSKSMLARDIAPNRLARAKLATLDLMRLAKSDRLGIVAFAGTAFLQCPLTIDDTTFRQSLDLLDVNLLPQGGTALAEAINTALTAFKEENNYKVLVLLTDGEDHDSGALEAAERTAKAGLRIFTIGIGTAEGELLRIKDDKGQEDYVRDEQGNVVKSRLNEALLQQIAGATEGGFYLPLRGAKVMEMLYERGLAPLPKSEGKEKFVRRYHERYHWLLALALVLMVVEMLWPEAKRLRTRTGKARPSHEPPGAGAQNFASGEAKFCRPGFMGAMRESEIMAAPHEPPFAFGRDAFHPRPQLPAGKMGTRWNASLPDSGVQSASFSGNSHLAVLPQESENRVSALGGVARAALFTVFFASSVAAAASPSSALRDYDAGRYDESLRAYQELLQRKGDDPRLRFNAGAAAYRSRQFDEAARQFGQAATAPDLKLQEHAYYNLGNALYRAGETLPDPQKRTESWEGAVKQYDRALKLNTNNADARFNREFLKKMLEELKQQQKQDKQDQKDQQNQEDQQQQNQPDRQDQRQQQQQDKQQEQKDQQQEKRDSQSDQQKKQQEQNQSRPDEKQKQEQQQSKPSEQEEKPSSDEQQREAQPVPAGLMTPEEAKRLLDAQKAEERLLQFRPEGKPADRQRPFKDW